VETDEINPPGRVTQHQGRRRITAKGDNIEKPVMQRSTRRIHRKDQGKAGDSPLGIGFTGTAIRTDKPAVKHHILTDPEYKP